MCTVLINLHRDQRGTISIVSVFAMLLLTMLLGMVMNVGRQVDGKIRMQNATDAAAYSGGVVLARGMNTLAFTNHLLCDVFSVTAIMREARDRNSASYVPGILAAWKKVGGVFSGSKFPKFAALGSAILQEVPLEQAMVDSYSDWASAASQQILPLMEEILSGQLIPQYQRAVVAAFPDIAQSAAMAVAKQSSYPEHGRGLMMAAMWRTSGQLVGGDSGDAASRTLPVVDPELDNLPDQAEYKTLAQQQRSTLAFKYLNDWNHHTMQGFDRVGKMCQFSALWRSFTCGYLQHLLNVEYPDTNLPQVIRNPEDQSAGMNSYLEQYYIFLGVAYWKQVPELMPRVFDNPTPSDAATYAEVHLFIPRERLVWWRPPVETPGPTWLGGVPGQFVDIPAPPSDGEVATDDGFIWQVEREHAPASWDLLTQRWTCQLAPATQQVLVTVLQAAPGCPAFSGANFTPANLAGLNSDEITRISPH
jgi:hypothetical protein